MKRFFALLLAMLAVLCMGACDYTPNGTQKDIVAQNAIADELANVQATPTDIDYSLERYNLIRRTYWVNGQREKALAVPCPIDKPLGYIVLFAGNTIVGRFVVDGKVTSLNSFLTPNTVDKLYSNSRIGSEELADVDGSYGENDNGIFFFTPDGKYVEWTGEYLYSDIPFEISDPVVRYER